MCTSYHSSIKASKFPQCLKLADITPLCKICKCQNFLNKCLLFKNIISNHQCSFRKALTAHRCLLVVLLEKWKGSVDWGKLFYALLVLYFSALLYCYTCDSKTQCLRIQPNRTQTYLRLLAKYEIKRKNRLLLW